MKLRKYFAVMLLAVCACALGLFAACASGNGHEHSYGEWTDIVNTCEEHIQKRVCEDCGSEQMQATEASGHTYGDWTDFVNTCEKHVQKRVCSKCENEQFQDIDAVGHDYGIWTDLVNNCTQHVQKRVCYSCGNEQTKFLDASGHSYGDWADVVNTCEEHVQKRVCSVCENEQTQELEAEGHKYGDWADVVNTCEFYAQKRVCSVCKNEETQELETEGHKYGEWADVVNTCEFYAQKRVCSVCKNEETQELETEGHKYGEWTDLLNTCEEHVQIHECSVCGNEQMQELETEGHKYGEWTDVVNTCENHIQIHECSVCGNEQTRELEAEGHKYGEWADLVNNCKEHVQKRECSACENAQTRELEAPGHKYGDWTDIVNTCEERVQKRICSNCGEEQTQEIEANGHKYGIWRDILNTCEVHIQKRVCMDCGNEQIKELEAIGHNYGEWKDVINTSEKHVQKRICGLCGNEQTQELKAEGHTYGDWTDLINTCEKHVQIRLCETCNDEQTRELEASGHSYGKWTDLVNTCEKHIQLRICEKCDKEQTRSLDVTGHKFVNGICKVCGVAESFTLSKYNGTYGLNYFESNGFENESELYYRIDNAVRAFHVNGEDAENDGDGNFVFAEVNYDDLGLNADRALSVWKTYKDDNPLYYWFANSLFISGGKLVLLTEEEYSNGVKRKQYNNLVYSEVEKYAALTDKNDDAYRIALCYHDAIIEAVDYARDGSGRPQSAAWAHNIMGVIEKKGAVCESYARTFQLLLNYSGVENIFVTGDAGEAHAWNMVKLDDGNWYWCDLTWDDTPSWEWGISYYYFMVNDTQNVGWCDAGWGVDEKSFIDMHTAATPDTAAQYFLYDLPGRAESVYTANGIYYLVRDTFDIGVTTYAVTGYNTVQLTWVTGELQGDLIIPETVTADDGNTYTVISLGGLRNGLFDDAEVLHWNLKEISVYIPVTVRFIWGHAFYSPRVANFYVDENNDWFTAVDGVLFTKSMKTLVLYGGANKRESYQIPDEVEQIAAGAFWAINLKNLDLGRGVKRSGAQCWGTYFDNTRNFITGWQMIINGMASGATMSAEGNPNFILEDGILYDSTGTYIQAVVEEMETIVIKARVTRIFNTHYLYTYGRRHSRFVVEEGNEVFASEDGILYNKDKTKIICALKYIEGEVRLADELISLDFSFWHTSKLTKISIGSNVEYIGKVFANRIPAEIIYRGTMEQWLAIEKDEKWNSSPAEGFKITCTDGVLDVDGNVLETFQ